MKKTTKTAATRSPKTIKIIDAAVSDPRSAEIAIMIGGVWTCPFGGQWDLETQAEFHDFAAGKLDTLCGTERPRLVLEF